MEQRKKQLNKKFTFLLGKGISAFKKSLNYIEKHQNYKILNLVDS